MSFIPFASECAVTGTVTAILVTALCVMTVMVIGSLQAAKWSQALLRVTEGTLMEKLKTIERLEESSKTTLQSWKDSKEKSERLRLSKREEHRIEIKDLKKRNEVLKSNISQMVKLHRRVADKTAEVKDLEELDRRLQAGYDQFDAAT